MSGLAGSGKSLTQAQTDILWRLAQFKYGWAYLNTVGQRSAGRALERRGLVSIEINHTGFTVEVTDAGMAEVAARWPNSCLALGTYTTPPGGWDKR